MNIILITALVLTGIVIIPLAALGAYSCYLILKIARNDIKATKIVEQAQTPEEMKEILSIFAERHNKRMNNTKR